MSLKYVHSRQPNEPPGDLQHVLTLGMRQRVTREHLASRVSVAALPARAGQAAQDLPLGTGVSTEQEAARQHAGEGGKMGQKTKEREKMKGSQSILMMILVSRYVRGS